ncbi:LOW QUALITY PROTEIN: cell cycle checkpoint control protein RAD9A [Clupea harengus]|uniref:Cell cycle checkpoint control protein RAD9A n=1 Tax=Clupea harengus TaxID=7950 RepID=A0A6P8EPU1_CLUHA|nr:LOW QUALITY PROTEIN: cell cycle checkpoint control protein RAD9A [Clupea harengus]
MDYVATGSNVKVLAKAIHSLSRIGEELYFESTGRWLALRTVNSSRSAFACFHLCPLFFQRFHTPQGDSFRCKMPIKSVQAVFKSLSSLEKTVEKCRIEWKPEQSQLTFTLHCKMCSVLGLLKTHNLSFQDCESLQAVFDKERSPNVLRAQPRLLVDTVLHFPPSLEEVTLSVTSDRMWLKNHVEDESDQSQAMMTELYLSSEEFEDFVVTLANQHHFCLKELSAPTAPPPDDFMCDAHGLIPHCYGTSEIAGPSTQINQPPRSTHAPTPPNHRLFSCFSLSSSQFRSLFFGSVLPTPSQGTSQTLQGQDVLASDSEDEGSP